MMTFAKDENREWFRWECYPNLNKTANDKRLIKLCCEKHSCLHCFIWEFNVEGGFKCWIDRMEIDPLIVMLLEDEEFVHVE